MLNYQRVFGTIYHGCVRWGMIKYSCVHFGGKCMYINVGDLQVPINIVCYLIKSSTLTNFMGTWMVQVNIT